MIDDSRPVLALESCDGVGSGDNDKPFHFGGHPRVAAPWPFSVRQLARLIVLRASQAHRDRLRRRRSAKLAPTGDV
jgi:hypothetical protein